MPTHYTSLPTQESSDASPETIEFESDSCGDHDDNHRDGGLPEQPESTYSSTAVSGAYGSDTEYNHDHHYRPPSSSPLKSLPNHIDNANGALPSSPSGTTRISYTAGALLPTHYASVSIEETQNEIQVEDSNSDVVPEETQCTAPICHATAQTDAVPSCSDETTVHVPPRRGARILKVAISDTVKIIKNLPPSSIFYFCCSAWISFLWGIFGFILMCFLPSVHATQCGILGSIAGIGLMLIRYSTFSLAVVDGKLPVAGGNLNGTATDDPVGPSAPSHAYRDGILDVSTWGWLSYMLGTLGWTLLFISLIGFWVVEQCKSVLLASDTHQPELALPEEHEHTSPGSEPLAVPTPQEVEHMEAANLPAGV